MLGILYKPHKILWFNNTTIVLENKNKDRNFVKEYWGFWNKDVYFIL